MRRRKAKYGGKDPALLHKEYKKYEIQFRPLDLVFPEVPTMGDEITPEEQLAFTEFEVQAQQQELPMPPGGQILYTEELPSIGQLEARLDRLRNRRNNNN